MLGAMSRADRLPHAYPFRLAAESSGGELVFAPSANDAFGRGGPVPVWAVAEAMAQAAGLIAGSVEGAAVLVQVAGFRCPRPPVAGDRWVLSGSVAHRMGPLVRVEVRAREGGRLKARGIFTLRELAP